MFLRHAGTKGYLCSVLQGNYYKLAEGGGVEETAIFFLAKQIDVKTKSLIKKILRIGKYDN